MPAIFCVMGHPIGHSRSPEIHRRFASQLGIALEYRRVEVRQGLLAEAVSRFAQEGGRGCNITVPLKEEAAALSNSLGSGARLAGAANTLTVGDEDRIHGDNTDGSGLLRHLRCNLGLELAGATLLLLGAGGAARGLIPALFEANIASITLVNRTRDRALDLARRFAPLGAIQVAEQGAATPPRADLVINASSAGMTGTAPTIDHSAAAGAHCIDLAYGPAAEAFAAWARQGKARSIHDGWGMLVEQAAESFAIWHGQRPDTQELLSPRGG
ncbi:shikimate dehydrogenase [Candidatus Foliamicus sp.]